MVKDFLQKPVVLHGVVYSWHYKKFIIGHLNTEGNHTQVPCWFFQCDSNFEWKKAKILANKEPYHNFMILLWALVAEQHWNEHT